MPAARDAGVSAVRAIEYRDLAEAARVAVVASYGRNARVKTGSYLRGVKIRTVNDNNYKLRHYVVVSEDPNALSIEYGHEFRRKDKTPTGNRSRPTFIMTSAWASFPGA
jgi:hypothetical protein